MPNPHVSTMLQEMSFWTHSAEEVYKFHATTLIEDFSLPADYVIDMLHSLRAAAGLEYGD